MADAFSVAMCTYNGARFIGEQLASIASQTTLPKELVVCDDLSTDDTVDILNRFAANAPFPVRILVNTVNVGLIKNFERAIGLCSEAFIALCDQDDVWMPPKLERLAAEFDRAPDVGLIFSDAELIDENSCVKGGSLWESIGISYDNGITPSQIRTFRELLSGSTVTGATSAFRSRFKSLVLPIPDDLALIHDGWLALTIGAVASISAISEPLIKYRQHGAQQIGARPRLKRAAGVARAVRRTNSYEETLAIARRLRQRLRDRHAFNTENAARDLDARITHLETRAGLPQGRVDRIKSVLREFFALRYHRYSNGTSSAIKDLLA